MSVRKRSRGWIVTTHVLTTAFAMPLFASIAGAIVVGSLGDEGLDALILMLAFLAVGYIGGTFYSLRYLHKTVVTDHWQACVVPSAVTFAILTTITFAAHAVAFEEPASVVAGLAMYYIAIIAAFTKITADGFGRFGSKTSPMDTQSTDSAGQEESSAGEAGYDGQRAGETLIQESGGMDDVVMPCPHCAEKLPVPRDESRRITCPRCQNHLDYVGQAANRGPTNISSSSSPSHNSSSSLAPSVAMVGLEGAGKTVLATVLAKRLGAPYGNVFLNPADTKTFKHVESVWNTLQRGEWPASTPAGEMFDLSWTLVKPDEGLECEVRLVDAAGQDMRRLFEDDSLVAQQDLPETLRTLADYCWSASILLFLVNLGDFVGVADDDQRTNNEAALWSAMNVLTSGGGGREVALVFTQIDQHMDAVQQCGGSWAKVAAEYIPTVFNAHLRLRRIPVHGVSAVSDVQIVTDGTGSPLRVPRRGFRSEGVGRLIKLLVRQMRRSIPRLIHCPKCRHGIQVPPSQERMELVCPVCHRAFHYAPGGKVAREAELATVMCPLCGDPVAFEPGDGQRKVRCGSCRRKISIQRMG